MSNFDLKKYLVENKLTAASKRVNENSSEVFIELGRDVKDHFDTYGPEEWAQGAAVITYEVIEDLCTDLGLEKSPQGTIDTDSVLAKLHELYKISKQIRSEDSRALGKFGNKVYQELIMNPEMFEKSSGLSEKKTNRR